MPTSSNQMLPRIVPTSNSLPTASKTRMRVFSKPEQFANVSGTQGPFAGTNPPSLGAVPRSIGISLPLIGALASSIGRLIGANERYIGARERKIDLRPRSLHSFERSAGRTATPIHAGRWVRVNDRADGNYGDVVRADGAKLC